MTEFWIAVTQVAWIAHVAGHAVYNWMAFANSRPNRDWLAFGCATALTLGVPYEIWHFNGIDADAAWLRVALICVCVLFMGLAKTVIFGIAAAYAVLLGWWRGMPLELSWRVQRKIIQRGGSERVFSDAECDEIVEEARRECRFTR